jgi:crotonobetainyl-CoA:carnitine CoA-transferase CaiB-like acyl-CoA transferase
VIQSVSGFAAAQGAGGEPQLVRTIASDKVAALTAAQAITAALFARDRGLVGGHHVEISMLAASLQFLWPEVFWNHSFVGEEGVQRKPLISDFYRLLPTKDGFVTIIVVGDGEFQGACRGLGIPDLMHDPRFQTLGDRFARYSELFAEFAKGADLMTTAEVVKRMDEEGVPCARVNTLEDVLTDERCTHADGIIEYDHPQGGRLRQARPAAVFDGEANTVRRPAPMLGEHTDEVLRSLECSAEEIAALRQAGAVA